MAISFRLLLVMTLFLALSFSVKADFNTTGIVTTHIGPGNDAANDIILYPDGRLLVVGNRDIGGNQDFALARYKSNGSLDPTLNGSGIVTTHLLGNSDTAMAIILQPDGNFVAAGKASTKIALVRYNDNGSPDSLFDLDGKVYLSVDLEASANDIIIQPDGKIVFSGYTNVSGLPSGYNFLIGRLDTFGQLDTSFNGGLTGTDINGDFDAGGPLVMQPDGKFVVAGYSLNGSNYDLTIVRYNNNGTIDTNFGTSGIKTVSIGFNHSFGSDLKLQPDGNIVIVGKSYESASKSNITLVRLTSTGMLDTNFDSDGIVITSVGTASSEGKGVYLQPDGKLVVVGFSDNGSNLDFAVLRYLSNGTLDSNFGSSGIVTTPIGDADDIANSVVVQPDGKIIAVGQTNNGADTDFAIVRYTSNGYLDTINDKPLMFGLNTDHEIVNQNLALTIKGWNLNNVIGVQIRQNSTSINGFIQKQSNTMLTTNINLPNKTGLYDLYLASTGINQTYHGTFLIQDQITQPENWEIIDLGKAGSPIVGPAGIAVADIDGDGQGEVYVANSDNSLYVYKKNTTWSITPLPTESGQFTDIIIDDVDLDGSFEVYGANNAPHIYQYKWTGSNWDKATVNNYGSKLAKGYLAGGGFKELYAVSANSLAYTKLFNQVWATKIIHQGSNTMLTAVCGDADNDDKFEIYAASSNYTLYQYKYSSDVWTNPIEVLSTSNNFTSFIIADLDNDGANELYGSNLDGKIYQLKKNGFLWDSQIINSTALVANKLIVTDADNNGSNELYVAAQDGHIYQYSWTGSSWSDVDLGDAGVPLIALASGAVGNNQQLDLYAVGNDAHVYQYKLQSLATPTPTPAPPTLTPTYTATPLHGFDGKLISKKYTYLAPNPVRGHQMKFVVHVKEACQINVKMYTTSNQFVLDFDVNCSGPGKYEHQEYVGNLANGVYLLLVKAKNNAGVEEKLIKKMGLIK